MFSAQFKFLRKKNISSGFTLIELLVVISIIALLFGTATVSYGNVQMKARDGTRKADLVKVQQALAQFYADYGAYPDEPPNDHMSCSTIVNTSSSNWIDAVLPDTPADYGRNGMSNVKAHWGSVLKSYNPSNKDCSGSITYMAKLPLDPLGIDGWSKPGETSWGSEARGYVYEVKQTSSGGWCATTWGGKCKKYALFARLENENDPDKYVDDGSNSVCYDIVHSSSGADNDWYATTKDGKPVTWYCVHSP